MKRFFVLLLCCVACLGAMSQIQTTKVVKGVVIDKYGNPLPGAVVEATGGAESTYVDADGTFSLEVPVWLKSLTAKYAGMSDKRRKITDDELLVFEMHKSRKAMFVNAVVSALAVNDYCSHSFQSEDNRAGLMIGSLGDWGWYVKVLLDTYDVDLESVAVTVGFTKGVTKNLYLYSGFGIATIEDFSLSDKAHSCYEHGVYHCHNHSQSGFMVDCGLMANFLKYINLNLGFSLCTDRAFGYFAAEPVVGIGITF